MLQQFAANSDAAEHRYRAGVGSILELLNTQTALANAPQRRVQAITEWHNAKIQLAAKLGKLNLNLLATD